MQCCSLFVGQVIICLFQGDLWGKYLPIMIPTDVLLETWPVELVYAIVVHTLNFHTVPFCVHDDTWVCLIVVIYDAPLSNVLCLNHFWSLRVIW